MSWLTSTDYGGKIMSGDEYRAKIEELRELFENNIDNQCLSRLAAEEEENSDAYEEAVGGDGWFPVECGREEVTAAREAAGEIEFREGRTRRWRPTERGWKLVALWGFRSLAAFDVYPQSGDDVINMLSRLRFIIERGLD